MIRNLRGLLHHTDLRYWGIAFVLVLFAVVSLVWELPARQPGQGSLEPQDPGRVQQAVFRLQVATPVPADGLEATPTRTPFPAELLANYKQTTGIIVFAGVVVLIIVGGVFFQLIHERNSPT